MEIIDIYNYNDANKIQMKRNNVRTYIHPTGIHILGWYMYTCVFSNTHFYFYMYTSILYQDKYGKHRYVHHMIASITRRMTLYRHIPAESRQLI